MLELAVGFAQFRESQGLKIKGLKVKDLNAKGLKVKDL